MTDFTLSPNLAVTFENLEWDLTPVGQRRVFGGTLAVAAFTAAQHYPDGYIKSGIVLALANAGVHNGFLVPYLNTFDADPGAGVAPNGHDIAVGLLVASVPVNRGVTNVARARLGVAYATNLVVSVSRLPYTAANAPLGGYLDAPARADLPQMTFSA